MLATVSYLPTAARPVDAVPERSVSELFEYVFARYHRPMRAFLFRKVENWALAEDLTSEMFASLWRDMDRGRIVLERPDQLYGFLAMRARWQVQHYWWGGRRTREIAASQWFDERQFAQAETAPTELSEMRIDLGKMLAHLTEEQRRAVQLRLIDGLSEDQAAAKTGWSGHRVSRHLASGLDRLREHVGIELKPLAEREREQREAALQVYRESVQAGRPVSLGALGRRFGCSRTWATDLVNAAGEERQEPEQYPRHRVCDALRADLEAGVYEPGACLSIAAVAATYGAKLTTASKAIYAMHAAGLLEQRGLAGTSRARYHVPDQEILAKVIPLRPTRPATLAPAAKAA